MVQMISKSVFVAESLRAMTTPKNEFQFNYL